MLAKRLVECVWILGIFAGPWCTSQAQVSSRLGDPLVIPASGNGWDVEPRQGRMGMTVPVASVPGPIPIPVAVRVNGAFSTKQFSYKYVREVVSGGRLVPKTTTNYVTTNESVFGTVHFGYIAPKQEISDVDDYGNQIYVLLNDAVYVLEDGTVFRPTDLVSFTSFNPTFTLPPDFGLSAKAPADVNVGVVGNVAVYTASPSELGSWRATVEGNLPVGFGAAPTTYTVVMDKDRARVFANLPALRTSVPLLWLDRFGHAVTFKWTRIASGLPAGVNAINAVEVRNHVGKGVQVQWAEYPFVSSPNSEQIQDLAKISFIGMQAPAALLKGYPGLSNSWPTAVVGGGTNRMDSRTPQIAGLMARPTSLRVGSQSDVGNPSWIGSGIPLPSVPSDGTASAFSMWWNWDYDPNHAEFASFTDASSVRTAFTYKPTTVTYPASTASMRSVIQTVSTDLALNKSLSKSWTAGTTSTGDPNMVVKETFGDLATAARSTEIVYVSSAASQLQYGNGAFQRVTVSGTDGVTSKTTLSLGTMGLAPSYSRPIRTDVERTGEPTMTQIVTTDALGIQTLSVETRVNDKKIQLQTNTYEAQKDKLDPGRITQTSVTRYDPATGAALAGSTTQSWAFGNKGLPTDVYQTGTLGTNTASSGTTYTFDAEGRLTGTKPYGVANAPWTTSQVWETGAWRVNSSITSFQNLGDGTGVFSGLLTQSIQSFDSSDRPITATDARGVSTTTTYDIFGRICSVQTAGQGLVSYSYASDNRSRTMTRTIGQDAQGQDIKVKIVETLDGFGRTTRRDFQDGSAQEFTFDELGRPDSSRTISNTGVAQAPSTVLRDTLDRPVSTTTPGGASQSIAYSVSGNNAVTTRTMTISDGTSSQSVVAEEHRDGFGQVVKTVAPDNGITEIAYDGLGNATSTTLTPAGGGAAQVRSFGYDPLGRVTQKNEPETGTITFSNFNALGQPTTVTEASGRVRSIVYDGLGRTRQVTSSDGGENLSYTFSGADLTTSSTVSDGGTVTQSFEYNNPGKRLSKETTVQTGFTSIIQYGFDAYGKMTTLTYPSGRVVGYGYDSLGRITSVTSNGVNIVSNVQFNEWGQRKELDFASNAYSQWVANPQGTHLAQWNIGYAGGVFPDGRRSYTYDTGERLTKAGEWNLVHNPMGQVTQASFQSINASNPDFYTFHTYDAYGNQTSHTTASGTASVPVSMNAFDLNPMPTNRVSGVEKNGTTITGWNYNANGEATSIGVTTGAYQSISLAWDALGRMAAASAPGSTQYYAYDPSGLRVSLRDTADASRNRKYAYTSGGMLLSEHSSTGVWKRDVIYLGGEAVAEIDGNGVHELHKDHLGTPRIVTKGSTGQIEGRQAYGPYGEAMANNASDNTYVPLTGYTGHVQTDATGLIYMRGRFYSPAWHRFVNSDQGVDPNQWNQMAYAGGSPFHAIDPSGMYLAPPRLEVSEYYCSWRIDTVNLGSGQSIAYVNFMGCTPSRFRWVADENGDRDAGGGGKTSSVKKNPCDDPVFGSAVMRDKMKAMRNKTIMQGVEQGTFVTGQGNDIGWSQGPGSWVNRGKETVYTGALPENTIGHIHTHPSSPAPSSTDLATYKKLNSIDQNIKNFYIVGKSGQINKIDAASGDVEVIAENGSWMDKNPCGDKK